MNNLMLDIETWDTAATAVVRAIAMMEFDPQSGEIGRRVFIDCRAAMDAQILARRTVSRSTVSWWIEQEKDLWAMCDYNQSVEMHWPKTLYEIMTRTYDFMEPLTIPAIDYDGNSIRRFDGFIWSRGHFDTFILADIFAWAGKQTPWAYWQERDVRTLDCVIEKIRSKRPHDPIADCEAQIEQVRKALALTDSPVMGVVGKESAA